MNAPAPAPTSLTEILVPIARTVPEPGLRDALLEAISEQAPALAQVERFFFRLPERPRSEAVLARYFHSWRATHLKMLAIYGLSCRLQRLAKARSGADRLALLEAAMHNAETSHEDLGIDYEGVTHAQLYLDFAGAFLGSDEWTRAHHAVPGSREFGAWVYDNMVVQPVEVGLLTNLLSEVYNHAEYTLAYQAFSQLVDRHHDWSPEKKEQALVYIQAHLEDDTEVEHFGCVLNALASLEQTTGATVDPAAAKALFGDYLTRLGAIFGALEATLDGEPA